MKAILLGLAVMAAPMSQTGVQVAEAVIATGVVDRAPTGTATTFPTSVGRVFCYTRLTGATAGTEIQHVWFHGDQEMARVTLKVGAAQWRTWSSKNVVPDWTGAWRVEVQNTNGAVLGSTTFTVQ